MHTNKLTRNGLEMIGIEKRSSIIFGVKKGKTYKYYEKAANAISLLAVQIRCITKIQLSTDWLFLIRGLQINFG